MKEFNNVGLGWRPILTQLFDDLAASGWAGNVLSIKEKLGELRVSVDPMTISAAALIIAAEEKSCKICEACGNPGRLVTVSSRSKTMCAHCHSTITEVGERREDLTP